MKNKSEQNRITIICPFSSGPGRGNITTVNRIARHLPDSGYTCSVISLDTTSSDQCLEILKECRPSLLHAFHAYHSGSIARTASCILKIPYIISITGSDLFDHDYCNAPETALAIMDSGAVTCFDHLVAQRLNQNFPKVADKTFIIPQGVAPLPVNRTLDSYKNKFLILLPAALRPVKGITTAIFALAPLASEMDSLQLLIVGGTIDRDYAAEVKRAAEAFPWVHLMGEIPYQDMGNFYAASDLVLNSSLFEGGMANTLLEAMAMGKPVVASDVLGNRSLIRHGETGWLYGHENELFNTVKMLAADPDTGLKVGKAGKKFVLEHCSQQTEADRYAMLYRRLTG